MMFIASPIIMRGSAHLGFKTDGPIVNLNGVHRFDIHSKAVVRSYLSRVKAAFSMIFCVNFNLWSWVHHLMARDEMTFCEFQRNKMLKSKLEALS